MGGSTPDRFPGKREEETLALVDQGAPPANTGEIQLDGTTIKGRDGVGVFDLRGLQVGAHAALDSLIHNLAESHYLEVTRASGQVTDVIAWTDSGKTTKVRECNISRTSGQVSSIVLKQYDGTGTLVQTLTGTVTRSGGQVASIDWVLT